MKLKTLFVAALLAGILAGCGPEEAAVEPQPQPTDSANAQPLPTDVIEPGKGGPVQGPVYLSHASIIVMESFPVQVSVLLQGDLPTPCHSFHYTLAEPDAENAIHLSLYSEAEPDVMCIQVLQPFEESIRLPMEGRPEGTYRVYVDGDLVGEFSYPG